MAASRERILCPWSSPGATTPGPRGLTAYPRKEATMQPSLFDLEVWADYQQSKMRRARQQADLPSPPSRLRIALAQALMALAHRLWQPAPQSTSAHPRYQPS